MKKNTEVDMCLLEIDSETGEVKLNGHDLQRVNDLSIHIDNHDRVRVAIDMDANIEKAILLIEGRVEWFKGIDRENYLRGQKD